MEAKTSKPFVVRVTDEHFFDDYDEALECRNIWLREDVGPVSLAVVGDDGTEQVIS